MSWESKVEKLLGHCTSDAAFGVSVIHTPDGGSPQALNGIWSDVYISVDPTDGAQIMSSDPNIGFRLSDFDVAPKKGDTIQKSGVNYIVRAVEPDGEGGTTLVLEREV